MNPTNINIYVGTVIQHESERLVLEVLTAELSKRDQWATIIANVHIDSHQVDFVVGTETNCLVLEAKRYSRPVRGNTGGTWEFRLGPDRWRPTRNAYQQTLDAKNALRDLMRRLDPDVQGYPNGFVVVVPRVPDGSAIPSSDFKVQIASLAEVPHALNTVSKVRWTEQQWRGLAGALGARLVRSFEEACSPDLFEAQQRLDTYRSEFLRTYRSDLQAFQSDVYVVNEREVDAAAVAEIALSSGEDLIVRGPSGCGKSLLSKYLAVEGARQGLVPVVIQAKHFRGRLAPLLEQEVALLGSSLAAVNKSARLATASMLLVLDGYNECDASQRALLTRSLAAMSLRNARLIVSSQADIERPDLLNLRCVTVREPSTALKAAIAQAVAPLLNTDAASLLLTLVKSGFEADIVGKVGGELPTGLSRSALVDAYSRKRLGANAAEGIRLLAETAGSLYDRFTFSISVRELDRLIVEIGASQEAVRAVHDARLLVARAGYVSFGHQLLLNAFASESVVRRASGSCAAILNALTAPQFDIASRVHILGAIDDERLCAEVLREVEDAQLFMAVADGQCGLFAQEWLNEHCQATLGRAHRELRSLGFFVDKDAWMGVRAVLSECADPSPSERAIYQVIAAGLSGGRHIEKVLEIVGVLDDKLAEAWAVHKEEAREKGVSLRSGLFACVYVLPSAELAIAAILKTVHSGLSLLTPTRRPKLEETTLHTVWPRARSLGQIYLLLALSRLVPDRRFVVPFVLPLFGAKWRFTPYHVRLDLLDLAGGLRDVEAEPWRNQLVENLRDLLDNENPIMNGMVFEALGGLGALQNDSMEHLQSVRDEIQEVLRGACGEGARSTAWSLYSRQFDHPFSDAYCEAINELSKDDTAKLLSLACDGADSFEMFLSNVIRQLGDMRYEPAAPAIARRAVLPAKDSFMPQESVSVFVSAHIALSQLGAELPLDRGTVTSPSDAAVLACGDLFYWSGRADAPRDRVPSPIEDAFATLAIHPYIGLAAVRMVCDTGLLDHATHSLVRRFPPQLLRLARVTVESPTEGFDYDVRSNRGDVLCFALQTIGRLGDRTDLAKLRSLCLDPLRGGPAVLAIREIEERTQTELGI